MKKAAFGMKNDQELMHWQDLPLALSLLTRVPVKVRDASRASRAAWAYPLVGLIPAGLAAIGGLVAIWIGWGAPVSALVSLSILVISTGAMHEDGLSDTADGLWGGWTAERRLEIMKDSRIGAYGVIALVLSLAARWVALSALFAAGPQIAVPALLAVALLSRAAMPVLMTSLPHARSSGMSHGVGTVPENAATMAVLIAIVLGIFLLGGQIIIAGLCAALVTWGMRRLAMAKIGGQTGDILGATQQVVEIAVLLCLLP